MCVQFDLFIYYIEKLKTDHIYRNYFTFIVVFLTYILAKNDKILNIFFYN